MGMNDEIQDELKSTAGSNSKKEIQSNSSLVPVFDINEEEKNKQDVQKSTSGSNSEQDIQNIIEKNQEASFSNEEKQNGKCVKKSTSNSYSKKYVQSDSNKFEKSAISNINEEKQNVQDVLNINKNI